jgi:hypothetical protein
MNTQLNSILTQQHIANLWHAAERPRLASAADAARRRGSRERNPITRASARLTRLSARLVPRRPRAATDSSLTPVPTMRSTS